MLYLTQLLYADCIGHMGLGLATVDAVPMQCYLTDFSETP